MKRLLFGTLDIESPNRQKWVQWLEGVEESKWFWDDYRTCDMLPLMTKNGGVKLSDAEHRFEPGEDFIWTDITPDFVKSYIENHIFNWMGMRSRIIIIRTAPSKGNAIHIDCSPHAFGTLQHKFRIVLQGETETLYFHTKEKDIEAPRTDKPFIMDGSWPHGMTNTSDKTKYTLCIGSPWSGSEKYPGLNKLLEAEESDLPKEIRHFFHPKYKDQNLDEN